jgi:hypothetical protein
MKNMISIHSNVSLRRINMWARLHTNLFILNEVVISPDSVDRRQELALRPRIEASTDWGKIPINQISLPQAMKTRL